MLSTPVFLSAAPISTSRGLRKSKDPSFEPTMFFALQREEVVEERPFRAV